MIEKTRSDLAHLAENFAEYEGTEDDLRRSSVLLRRLLNDGGLHQARALLRERRKPHIESFPLSQALPQGTTFGDITFGIAGGCSYGGSAFGPFVMSSGAQPVAPNRMVRETQRLDRYLASTCAVYDGAQITRRALINYIANKQGGAHLDTRRPNDKLRALDEASDISVDGHSPLFLELLSMIQATTSSPSVMEPFELTPSPSPLFDVPTASGVSKHEWPAQMFMTIDRLGRGTEAAKRPYFDR